jgi:glycosyltransferase involved in cell wall biosynthesis
MTSDKFPFPPAVEGLFLESLPDHGYKVAVIAPYNSAVSGKEIINGTRLFLIPTNKKRSVLNLLRDSLSKIRSTRTIFAALKNERFDCIQVRDDPVFSLLAIMEAKRRSIPFVFQYSHLKEEEIILHSKMGIYGNRLINFVKGTIAAVVRDWILKKADMILPIGDEMKTYLAEKGIPLIKMTSFPDGTDVYLENIDDEKVVFIQKKYGLMNNPLIIYAGTMNRVRKLEFLFSALKLVKKEIPNAKLLMIGGGREQDDLYFLKTCAEEMGVSENVVLTGYLPRDEYLQCIKSADVAVSPFHPNIVLKKNSPAKLIEYMSLRIPIVGNDTPEQKKILEESEAGYCVGYDEGEMATAIVSILKDPVLAKKMGQNGEKYVRIYRSYSAILEILESVYERLGILPKHS